MGRKRSKPADNWMPPRTYRGRSAYEFKPKLGGTLTLGEKHPAFFIDHFN
ncbi:Phage integrase, partial [Candidatus Regiella insecticola 5.15]